jgi:hypothetical protein
VTWLRNYTDQSEITAKPVLHRAKILGWTLSKYIGKCEPATEHHHSCQRPVSFKRYSSRCSSPSSPSSWPSSLLLPTPLPPRSSQHSSCTNPSAHNPNITSLPDRTAATKHNATNIETMLTALLVPLLGRLIVNRSPHQQLGR